MRIVVARQNCAHDIAVEARDPATNGFLIDLEARNGIVSRAEFICKACQVARHHFKIAF